MTCPQNGIILRLLAGELNADARRELHEHLDKCPACRSAHEELKTSWDALGDWQVDLSEVDLTDRVLARLDEQAKGPLVRWAVPLRAAASIILAVGLGIGAGRLVPAGQSGPANEPPAALENIAEALELIGLAAESATGLPLGLEANDAIATEEMP